MILDKFNLFADNLAYNGTVTVIDLGAAGNLPPYHLRGFIQGHSLTGVTAVTISDGSTSSPSTLRATYAVTAAVLNGKPFIFQLPPDCQRYITMGLTGATGGAYTAGLVADGVGIAA